MVARVWGNSQLQVRERPRPRRFRRAMRPGRPSRAELATRSVRAPFVLGRGPWQGLLARTDHLSDRRTRYGPPSSESGRGRQAALSDDSRAAPADELARLNAARWPRCRPTRSTRSGRACPHEGGPIACKKRVWCSLLAPPQRVSSATRERAKPLQTTFDEHRRHARKIRDTSCSSRAAREALVRELDAMIAPQVASIAPLLSPRALLVDEVTSTFGTEAVDETVEDMVGKLTGKLRTPTTLRTSSRTIR